MSHSHDVVTEHGVGQKTLLSYVLGFVLSLVLTLAAFSLVQLELVKELTLYVGLVVLAIVQLFVQTICFLRLNASKEGQWNLLPFIFTIMIIGILVGGSLWIMYNLNYNMYH